jgi:beta-hydroxylase
MKAFYNLRDKDWVKDLELKYPIILQELQDLLANGIEKGFWLNVHPDYVEGKTWRTFELVFFGMKIMENVKLCPETFKIISQIPNLITVDFSLLPANTKILPHKGYSRMILRSHLPLVVPQGDLGIKVNGITKKWVEGQLISFDDSLTHEAWNNSNEDRIVMMIDIAMPDGKYSKDAICEYKMKKMDDPFLLSLATPTQWLEMYEKKEISLERLKT